MKFLVTEQKFYTPFTPMKKSRGLNCFFSKNISEIHIYFALIYSGGFYLLKILIKNLKVW